MVISKIQFPEHLKEHNLSAQDLALLSANKQEAIGIDWNIMRRQNEWMIEKIVFIHNVMAEQDTILGEWKQSQTAWVKLYRLFNFLFGTGGLVILIWKLMERHP